MLKAHKKQPKRTLTAMQRKAFDIYAENGGKKGAALKAAGYAPKVVANPSRVFNSITFATALEKEGISDAKVAKRYSRLLNSSRVDRDYFEGWKVKGKWQYPSDDEIRIIIEGEEGKKNGCELMYTRIDNSLHRKLIVYRHPDNAVQKGMVELVGKVKSHFAPEKLGIVVHELSEDERKLLEGINGK